MELTSLTALSPLDGRYQTKLTSLRPLLSEYGLMRYRVQVEIDWVLFLARELRLPDMPKLPKSAYQTLEAIRDHFGPTSMDIIKRFEKETNHDVKAVEYFLQAEFEKNETLKPLIPFIHFACTSEDINNLAYALMLKTASDEVLLPSFQSVIAALKALAKTYADLPMLSRTHGQAATPTTVGKEIANFVTRLQAQHQVLTTLKLTGKINGAVGNFNAHRVAYPEINWPKQARHFVESLGLDYNEYTTQIEPHDRLAELFQVMVRINNIFIDCCRDFWGYISLNYFQQKSLDNEVGSSTMPHKINPIDFENAEGNFGLSNALFNHFANKLTISRWQRDLSDSTVMRNIGTAFGYALLGYQSIEKGLSKLTINTAQLSQDLSQHWEVLAESLQTVMRRYGITDAYEQLKKLTRGKSFDRSLFLEFIDDLSLPPSVKAELKSLTPASYIGFATELAKKIG